MGTPASTSFCSETGMSSKPTAWWPMSNTMPRWRRSAPIASEIGMSASLASRSARAAAVQVVREIVDGFVGGLEEAVRLRFERERHGFSGPRFDPHQVGGHAQDVLGVAGDHVRPRHARLEAERRGLNRRRQSFGRDVGEDVGDVDRVLRPLLAPPVRLVHLLFDDGVLEGAVGERIHRVEIQVVLGHEALQPVARLAVLHQRVGGRRRQTERQAKRLGSARLWPSPAARRCAGCAPSAPSCHPG